MSKTLAALAVAGFLVAPPASAQSSASYRLEEHVLNSGGSPSDGTSLASANYALSLVSIGEGIASASTPTSASYAVATGFPAAYPAPGEVTGLTFSNGQTLVWTPEHSAGSYNLYRNTLGSLSGLGYGNCEQPSLVSNTAIDTDNPASGDGFFYLITVENRLREEGIKGVDSSGTQRTGGACP